MKNLADELSKNPPSEVFAKREAAKRETSKPPEKSDPTQLKKFLDKTKLPKFFKMKGVLRLISLVSTLAAVLTVVLFSRYVFDCASAEESVQITVNNTLGGKLQLNSAGQELYGGKDQLELFQVDNAGFFLSDTDDIGLTLHTKAEFSKPIKASYTVSMQREIVMRNSGGRVVPFHKSYDTQVLLNEAAVLTQEIKDGTGAPVELDDLLGDIDDFNGKHPGWSSVDILVTFTAKYKNEATNKIIANVSTGVSIKIESAAYMNRTSHTYSLVKTGTPKMQGNFPPREISMPTLFEIVGVTLLLAGLIAAFMLSRVGLRTDRDPYKKTVNGILHKYRDDVAVARFVDFPKETAQTTVENFKELLKFSQHLGKPIIFAEKDPGSVGVFYILCDQVVYQYEVRKSI